ncbi:protein RIC-3 [Odontesthes bonariensis]
MTITTCQKVTLISCSVLCISLFLPRMLLPRGKKEKGQPEVGPGFYSSVMYRLSVPEDPDQWDVDPSPSLTHAVEAMAKVKSLGQGKKYNLIAQAIPIYGFGILLYIFYIIYKLTCKGKANKSGNYTTVTNANVRNTNLTDSEFARLQERLQQAEMKMERIISGRSACSSSGRRRKSKSSTSKKEEKLLRQLRQITLLMQEGRLEGASPEMEAEQVPYGAEWEGYPEETYPEYDVPSGRCGFETIRPEQPPIQPTAEALAERMEQEEEELMARKLSIVQEEEEDEDKREDADEDEEEEVEETEEEVEEGVVEEEEEEEEEDLAEKKQLLSPPLQADERRQERLGLEVSRELQRQSGGKKQISFSEKKHVFRYPREDTFEDEQADEVEEEDEDEGTEVEEEDEGTEVEEEEEAEDDDEDPLMEAESLLFSCEGSSNPEEEAEEDKEELLLMSVPVEGDGHVPVDVPKEVGVSGLRMRNRRET